jgi:hypothetical protein
MQATQLGMIGYEWYMGAEWERGYVTIRFLI